MADMILAAGLFGQRDVALHLPPFAFGADSLVAVLAAVAAVVDIAAAQQAVDLAMGHDRFADRRSPPHGLLHQLRRLHAAAVVGEPDDVRGQRREIDQLPAAPLPHRDGGVGHDPHHGVAADQVGLHPQVFGRVGHRIEVGHRADGRIAAAGRRHRAGGDGLLVREARFAQVDMHVDQSGHNVPAAQIDRAVGRRAGPVRHKTALLDEERPHLELTSPIDAGIDIACFHRHRDKICFFLRPQPAERALQAAAPGRAERTAFRIAIIRRRTPGAKK